MSVSLSVSECVTSVCFSLAGVELPGIFRLDKSGSLCLQKDRVLDREVTAFTNLVVRASDDCNEAVTPSHMEPSHNNRPQMYDPLDTSLLWVKVNVRDVNDFRPVFVRRDLALGITRDVQLGKIIYNLKVGASICNTNDPNNGYLERLARADTKRLERLTRSDPKRLKILLIVHILTPNIQCKQIGYNDSFD